MSSLPSPLYVGIDVSKAYLDVAFGLTDESQRFTNDEKGISHSKNSSPSERRSLSSWRPPAVSRSPLRRH